MKGRGGCFRHLGTGELGVSVGRARRPSCKPQSVGKGGAVGGGAYKERANHSRVQLVRKRVSCTDSINLNLPHYYIQKSFQFVINCLCLSLISMRGVSQIKLVNSTSTLLNL